MTVRMTQHDWENFRLTQDDLDRIANRITQGEKALNSTELVKRLVRGRLRHGADAAPDAKITSWNRRARPWDGREPWRIGDYAYVLDVHWENGIETGRELLLGQAIEIADKLVIFRPDGNNVQGDRKYSTDPQYDLASAAENTKKSVEEALGLDKPLTEQSVVDQVERIPFEYRNVTDSLLNALSIDPRFVELEGKWFLRKLCEQPAEQMLKDAAWNLWESPKPLSTSELYQSLVPEPSYENDAQRFGLFLSLDQSPIFERADGQNGLWPTWQLAGPPLGPMIANKYAYDPITYQIMCMPGKPIGPKAADWLWRTDLLRAVEPKRGIT